MPGTMDEAESTTAMVDADTAAADSMSLIADYSTIRWSGNSLLDFSSIVSVVGRPMRYPLVGTSSTV